MNLLMVSPHLPNLSSGAGMRSYYLLKALAREHTVSLLALTARRGGGGVDVGGGPLWPPEEAHGAELAEMTRMLWVVPRPPAPARRKRSQQLMSILRGGSYLLDSYSLREVQQELDAILARDHYDAVIFESVFMAGYRLPENVSAIIDQHNIEYELLQRTYRRETEWSRKAYNWWESRLLKPVELERCRKARVVLVTSERERLLLKQLLQESEPALQLSDPRSIIEVVPNGVDTNVFDTVPMSQESEPAFCLRARGARQLSEEVVDRIIFTGTMNYYPNIDAVLYFARECWPLILSQVPGATWQIVGKAPPPEVTSLAQLPGITVTGSVPDVTCYLAAATVAIAPILIGGGTRLKILEALAMRKAVVSTSRGCEGLAVIPGKHLIVADQAQTFAQAVVDLMRDRERRKALGNVGRALVEAQYSWDRCGDQAIRALRALEKI